MYSQYFCFAVLAPRSFACVVNSCADVTSFVRGTAIEPHYHALVLSAHRRYDWCALTLYIWVSNWIVSSPVKIRLKLDQKIWWRLSRQNRKTEVGSIYIPFWHPVAIPAPNRLSSLHQEMLRSPLYNRPYIQNSQYCHRLKSAVPEKPRFESPRHDLVKKIMDVGYIHVSCMATVSRSPFAIQ